MAQQLRVLANLKTRMLIEIYLSKSEDICKFKQKDQRTAVRKHIKDV